MNFGNIAPLNQVYIPLSQRGGFKNLESTMAHERVVGLAQNLRNQSTEMIQGLMSEDVADIQSTPSVPYKDLADGKGHVIMLAKNESGSTSGVELKYNPESGRANSFVADLPEGKLTMGADLGGDDGISPTYKWETNHGGNAETTYFKFDDKSGTLAILDPNNQQPSILDGVDPNTYQSGSLIANSMTIFPF